MSAGNLHASAIVLGDRGILITGPSGSGKTTLALSLVAHWDHGGQHARLVSDDQVFLAVRGGRLICRQAPAIAGLAEIIPLGPRPVADVAAALVDLVVVLRPVGEIGRLADVGAVVLDGVTVPAIDLPMRSAPSAMLAVASWLGHAAFAANGPARGR